MYKIKEDYDHTFCMNPSNFSLPFEAECYSAGKPIAFFHEGMFDGNLSMSIYETELMTLVLAIQHQWHYLLDRFFVVHTDQKSLKYFLRRVSSPCQQMMFAKGKKYVATTLGVLLQSLSIPKVVCEDISLDFITGLPKANRYQDVLVEQCGHEIVNL